MQVTQSRKTEMPISVERSAAQHRQKGNMGNTDINNYIPKSNKGNKSPMSIRLVNETGNSGYPRFWQTQCGYIIYSIDNQPQCSYCSIPSHGRDTCRRRRNDESKGIFRIHHPQRGLLQKTESTQPNSSRDNITKPSSPIAIRGMNSYQLTKDGQYILNSAGCRLCGYCGIPSHKRRQCKIRIMDV